ncbi:purine nucleoside phosphorylase LACC1 isoform X2 [Phyllopteryx taeniolatus]|uniref:purine nucleoside phosphorylase LACC1 isoform X2 n=1 Tax=Phyllopteryx taeniolatus TaxID=161469 RepID=UPI002AD390A0|nr:purine nucleoside phosphorylase LACC1 isoform X2 [Phyllopteryx taeniolatus]
MFSRARGLWSVEGNLRKRKRKLPFRFGARSPFCVRSGRTRSVGPRCAHERAMSAAVLLDVSHSCRCGCTERLLREEAAAHAHSHLFVLCAGGVRSDATDALVCAWSGEGMCVLLDWRATAACAYRLKQAADEVSAISLRVITSPRGRARLLRYERALFTALYTFTYRLGCGADGPGREVDDDVTAFLQRLPAVGGAVRLLTSSLIPDCFGHGFSTRVGGVSRVPTLSSLNLFSSPSRRDSAAVVHENRRRLALHAGFYPRPLQMLKATLVSHSCRSSGQVQHSSRVWVLGKAEPDRYDAAVTDRPGTVLAAPGADCIPMIFADPVAKAIAVAHAGWRGTLRGVAAATVSAMTTELGCVCANILVVLGPSVGPCCFTLEPEQAARFHPNCIQRSQCHRPNVDIRLANRLQLEETGILPHHIHDDASVTTPCTSCHPQDFFSHVRDGAHFGTQVGFVWLKEGAGTASAAARSVTEASPGQH